MNISIIGTGATSSVIANILAAEKDVQNIFCFSCNKKLLVKSFSKSPKVLIVYEDVKKLSKKSQARVSSSAVLINAASPVLNEYILGLALKLGVNYQDLGAHLGHLDVGIDEPYIIEHLDYHADFKKQKLTALFDTGAAPGISNLLIAQAVDQLGPLKKVALRMVEDTQATEFIPTWSAVAMIDELFSPPVVLEKGKLKRIKRFSSPEDFNFPKPIGQKKTFPLPNNEIFTAPQYLSIRAMEVRSSGEDIGAGHVLFNAHLLENTPVSFGNCKVSPLEMVMKIMPNPPTSRELKKLMKRGVFKDGYFGFHIEAIPSKKGKKIAYWVLFPSQRELFRKKLYYTFIAYPAGVGAAACALEMPHIKNYGTVPPEALPKINRDRILARIAKWGIRPRRIS